MKRAGRIFATIAVVAAALPCAAVAAPEDFGLQSVEASLSDTQAGAHPDLSFTFEVKQDPATTPNASGLKDSYAVTRNIRFELPPGLIGNPNVLGVPQQCTVEELVAFMETDGGCPNGSQVGLTKIFTYEYGIFTEPIYMMVPPGGDVVARLGTIAGVFPIFVDFRVRSEGDYGLVAEVTDAPAKARLVRLETTAWGVPTASVHDTERCTIAEAIQGCVVSEPRPPGSRPLPFLTNPTRCGVPQEVVVSASSWFEPSRFDTEAAVLPPITGCDKLPFGPVLTMEPSSRRAGAVTGLDATIRIPGPDGVNVFEPSHMRDLRVTLPEGLSINPGSADGLGVCTEAQVRLGMRAPAACPDAAKLAAAEFEIAALPRRMKGAVYLRDPQPGNLFRIWIVADDLGANVKLPGQLKVDLRTGQIESVVVDMPQVPVREAKLSFFAGTRAPLVNPPTCQTYFSRWQFTPWSGTPPASGKSAMTIDEGCGRLGGFSPDLSSGPTDLTAGQHSPFLFTLTREDGEQNPQTLDVALPNGVSATLAGVERCIGAAAASGSCPADSRIGSVRTAVGYGSAPLWVPQAGKSPTAVYLGGPYKGAPLSIIAVVPAQAGPFDLGNVVVRSALHVDPRSARGTVHSDPLPQIIEGIPIAYRTIHVHLDRPRFTLNPTNCRRKTVGATVRSTLGREATPSAGFQPVECGRLGFKPRLFFRLFGGTKRGDFPKLRVVLRARARDANIGKAVATLPRSEFLEQGHIRTVCTRVQHAADRCPKGSIYGRAKAISPLLDKPLAGPVYLRSSNNPLPDLVASLRGEVDIELVGEIDSVENGRIRTTFRGLPDAPVSKFILTMQGGRKGLLVNSRNICSRPGFVQVKLRGHNGKRANQSRRLKSSGCGRG